MALFLSIDLNFSLLFYLSFLSLVHKSETSEPLVAWMKNRRRKGDASYAPSEFPRLFVQAKESPGYDDFFIIRKCGLARGKYFNTAQYSRCKTTLPLSLSPPFSLPPHFFSKDSGETFLIRKAKLNCDCVFTFFLGSKFN